MECHFTKPKISNLKRTAMKPKFRVILDQAIEEGVRRGYHRAYKHTDDPTDEAVINTIEDCVMSAIHEYFDFDDEV
jgi:archaeosine-15-forming tRNA-guanine transglycosylase